MHSVPRARLSFMMFLHFFVLGCTNPIMSLYFRQYLGFSGMQAGLILAMGAVAAFAGPFMGSFVADRLLSAERLFALNHLLSAALLLAVYLTRDFTSVLLLGLFYMLFLGPCTSLANAITFHHLPPRNGNFGAIRVWGTIGWIAVGWLFSFLWLRDSTGRPLPGRLPHALLLAVAGSVVLAVFVFFFLHKVPGSVRKRRRLFPAESLQVLRRPEILFLACCVFLISIVDRFYSYGAAPFLKERGVSEAMILPLLSLGQLPELFAMFFLSRVIGRFGTLRIIAVGIFFEVVRFFFFALHLPFGIAVMGIGLHGMIYTFIFIVANIYLDRHCSAESRAGVHQFFSMINTGAGALLGNALAGFLQDRFRIGAMTDWTRFWLVPMLVSLAVLLLFVLKTRLKEAHDADPVCE